MKLIQRLLEQAAAKVPAEKFTWMKYKGAKNKILTHTKRNGEEVKTRLESDGVYGYRYTKKKGVEKPVAQIVLKQDAMTYVYEILQTSFDKLILKYSKPTVIPKALKTVDLTATEKAPATTEVQTKAGGVAKKSNSVEVDNSTKVVKTRNSTNSPKSNSIVWESEDKNKYIKVVGTEGAKVEYELYIKERGRFVRRGQLISDKGLTYALRSFKSMSADMRDDGKTDDNEPLRSEIKLLIKKYKIKQADMDYFKNEVIDDPNNLEQIKKVVISYGRFFEGVAELEGSIDRRESLEAFSGYAASRIRWGKDSLAVVQSKTDKLFNKYQDENWTLHGDEEDEDLDIDNSQDTDNSDSDDDMSPAPEVDMEQLLKELQTAYPNAKINNLSKFQESLIGLASDYGLSVEELVLDLSELSEESNGNLVRALNTYRGKH